MVARQRQVQPCPLLLATCLHCTVSSSWAHACQPKASCELQPMYLKPFTQRMQASPRSAPLFLTPQEDFRNFWDECPWEEDLWYARDVCDSLGVELEVGLL